MNLGPFTPNIKSQLCNDASDSAVIENNRVTTEWDCNPFSSDSIVFNENSITRIIAVSSLTKCKCKWALKH